MCDGRSGGVHCCACDHGYDLERRLLISLAQLTLWMLCASESRCQFLKYGARVVRVGELNWYLLSGMY